MSLKSDKIKRNGLEYDPIKKELYGGEITDLNLDPRGIGWVLFEAMRKWKDQNLIAQIDAKTEIEDPYKFFLSRCIRTAISMKALGIKKGDIIAICSNNHLNSIIPLIAGLLIGAIISPMDVSISKEDITHLLNLVKPKLVFVSEGSENLLEESLQDAKLTCEVITFAPNDATNKYRSFEWFLKNVDGDNCEDCFQPENCDDPKDTCLILFSSGTTGLAKGICLNHYFILKSIGGLTNLKHPVETYSGVASLYWISAVMIAIATIYLGKRKLVMTYDPENIWEYIQKFKVGYLFLAPVQMIKTLPYVKHPGKDLKYLVVSGSVIQPKYAKQIKDLFPDSNVLMVYGQTEVGFISTSREKDKHYYNLETVGFPVPGLVIKIVDPETEKPLGFNEIGEIRVKTDFKINGYYNLTSDDIWDKAGFNKTGDLGYIDEEFCLYITDRIKEMFKYMSWHIVPAKLEAVLEKHPDVKMAVVIGIPHPIDDNHALGIVTLREDSTITEEEIVKFVEEKVDDRHKLRAGVAIYKGEFPITATGKINRRELKNQIVKLFNNNNNSSYIVNGHSNK